MTQRDIRFWYQGEIVSVRDEPVQRTVLQWLRDTRHATGSKEGCGEGDCGACTVVVGSRDDAACGGLRLQAINSCIQLLPTLDGKALFTVESLGRPDRLHPVQQSMVDLHASQCGFCTPGFVMSLWADYENRTSCPSREEVADTLSGNLCRCTGYRPIIDAARAAWESPRETLDRSPVRAALDQLSDLPPLEYVHGGQRFFAPRGLDALAKLCQANPRARLLAGSTDVGLWVTKQLRDLGDIIYLGAVEPLAEIERQDDWLEIGAGATLTDAFAALCELHPEWEELAHRFASVPVRNAGTLGGNVANGSPIGDSMPGLIALGARVVLQQGARLRELALEDFYLAYQKTAREPGEFVRALRVPVARPSVFRTWKVSKRIDQDISAVCGAFLLDIDDDGIVRAARIAYGGMAATPKRAAQAESILLGQHLTAAQMQAAMTALARDYQPLSDMRATADYRLRVAQNLLWRLWLECNPDSASAASPHRLDAVGAVLS